MNRFFLPVLGILLLAAPASAKLPNRSINTCAGYTSFADYGPLCEAWEATAPDLVDHQIIGTSVDGRPIHALVLGTNQDESDGGPEIRIVGAHHGNECAAAETVLEIATWLVDGYGEDGFVTDLLDRAVVVLVPLVNPDGYSSEVATRENAHGVDLNRNYGLAWFNEGATWFSEPETRAIRGLSLRHRFVLGLTYHTVAEYVNGPWNYTPIHPPDAALIDALGTLYAGDSGYNVVFGWDWYVVNGDLNDWSYGTQGTLDWTIELRSDLELEWEVHRAGLEAFLAAVFTGVEGRVTDAVSGAPLAARIGIVPAAAPVFTDPEGGDFHRPLLPGDYTLTVEAPGYVTDTVEVTVAPGAATIRDVALTAAPEEGPATSHAFAVAGTRMPQVINNAIYQFIDYQNETLPFAALGAPDGVSYSLSPGGALLVDLGVTATDLDGADLEVVSGTGQADPIRIYAAALRDGPYTEVGSGTGTTAVDIAAAVGEIGAVRFLLIADEGGGPFNAPAAGFDADAIVVYASTPLVEEDTETDLDTDDDTASESDDGTDSASDSETATGSDPDTAGDAGDGTDTTTPSPDGGLDGGFTPPDAAGCGCRPAGRAGPGLLATLARLVLR